MADHDSGSTELAKKFTRFFRKFRGKDPHHCLMLLIGETGSGKTSFLNFLHNCGAVQALGCGFGEEAFEQFRQCNDIKFENTRALPMESKTNNATLYNVVVGEFRVGVIDTPGFGDSQGFEQDKKNVQRIITTLNDVDHINCVCLIINGRQPRETASLKYVLTEITAIMPKSILNNVIVVFTNTKEQLELTFDPTILKDYLGREVKQNHLFFVENPYCKFERAKEKVGQLAIGSDTVAKSLKKAFEEANKTLINMCETIRKFPPVRTHHFITLYEKKQVIERSVLTSLTAYDNQVCLEEDLKKVKANVDTAVRLKILNKDFRIKRRLTTWVMEQTCHLNTLCGYRGCHSNCHESCTLSMWFGKDVLKNCKCMGPEKTTCSVCGHDYKYHYHGKVLFREVGVMKELISEDMKESFEKAKNDEERAKMVYKRIENDIRESKEQREALSRKLFRQTTEFEKLGATRNYAKLIENQLAVIQTHLKGTTNPDDTDYLRKTKAEMEKRLELIHKAKSGITVRIHNV